MSKQPVKKHLLRVLLLSMMILLLGGGAALAYQLHQGMVASHASTDYVVGPPSLSAELVDTIFKRMGSPMVGTGQAVEAASRAQNIDDAFALGVWWTETNDGAAGVGLADRNPGSVRGSVGYPSAYDGYTIYPSYTSAVTYWFHMLKVVYIDRGLNTVSAISHPYVGTSTSNLWAGKVIALMEKYRGEAPPPTPTPTPTATVSAEMIHQAQAIGRQNALKGSGKTAPPVAANTPTVPAQPTVTATTISSPGLSANVRQMLVLFCLLLAGALGAWAWSVNRGAALVGNGLQERLRAGMGQADVEYGSLSQALSTTEALLIDASEIGELAVEVDTFILPVYKPAAQYPAGDTVAPWRSRFDTPAVAQLSEVSTEQMAALPGHTQFTQSSGMNMPARPTQTGSLYPRPGTHLLPQRPSGDLSKLYAAESTAWNWTQQAAWPSEPGPDTTSMGAQRPTGEGQSANGRSNGLLSRYRDTQEVREQ